jgi:hypothetical protein
MAKEKKQKQMPKEEAQPQSAARSMEMSLEQARAYRASLHKPVAKPLTDAQKREAFRIYWASNKKKYGKSKTLEKALWLHLKSIGMDSPEQFHDGLFNFGLKQVK